MTSMMPKNEFRKAIYRKLERSIEQLADKLYDVLAGDEASRVDEIVRPLVMELGDAAVLESLRHIGESLKENPPSCHHCGKTMRFKQRRQMVLRTGLTGVPHNITSPYFVCDDCHVGNMGVRQVLHLDEDGFTPFLRESAILAGTIEPFESASEDLLGKLAGVKVSGSKVHSLCAKAGETAMALAEGGQLGEARPLRPGEKLYVEIDGGMVFVENEWKEAKVAVAFPSFARVDVAKNRREVLHRRVCATLGNREDLQNLVFAMVEPFLPKAADGSPIIEGNVVVIADGAVWIRNLVEEVLPGALMILDWYHVSEHVAETALALYPGTDQKKTRKGWITRQMNQLDSGQVDRTLRLLAQRSEKIEEKQEKDSKKKEAVDKLHAYLSGREELLRYQYARNEGIDVGSGTIESAIDHVVQQRMKRSGMRWKKGGAKAMLALRCAYRSENGMATLFRELSQAA